MEITVRPVIDFLRTFDIVQYQNVKYPNKTALNSFQQGRWHGYSMQSLPQKIDAVASWLVDQNYNKGEKIVFVPVMGSPEWMILDFACQEAGLISVPIHPTSRLEEIETILIETEARLIITADAELYEKFRSVVIKIGGKIEIHHLLAGKVGYFEVMDRTSVTSDTLARLNVVKNAVSENDIFTILYTSGSSGVPKGVLLTHRNVVHNIKAILTLLPLEPGDRAISFLPFSHIFERATCYAYVAFGVSLYFSQNKESFAHDFRTVKPRFCTSVPRVLEKMYDFLEEQTLKKGFIKRKLIKWAMETGKHYKERVHVSIWFSIKLMTARLLVLSQWRKMLGGHIEFMIVGAASLRPDIGRLFSAAGIMIVEGYGMTEAAPLITINRYEPGLNRFGTVGMTIPGIEVRIEVENEEQEGEILIKGPNVTQGYFKQPELTKEVFTEDGWFRTGDVGKFVHQRFLQITDRKKDIFKTSSGKYIAPLQLQNHFAKSAFVQRCLIIGFQRPFVTALVVPHFSLLESWCSDQGIHWTSPQFMVHNIKVIAKIKSEIDNLNESLPNFQRIRDFVLCHAEWTIESGEITNTLKPVRHLLVEHYRAEIEKMYQ